MTNLIFLSFLFFLELSIFSGFCLNQRYPFFLSRFCNGTYKFKDSGGKRPQGDICRWTHLVDYTCISFSDTYPTYADFQKVCININNINVFVSFFHFSYTFAKLVLLLKIRYRNSDYFLSKILYSFFYCCVFNSIHTIWECVLIPKISVIGYSFEIEIEKMSF